MGLKSFIKGVAGTVAKATPDPAENLLFGKKSGPPVPTTDEDARKLIDNTIGRQEGDYWLVQEMHNLGLTSKAVQAFDSVTNGGFSLGPYSPDQRARFATGQINQPPDPYVIADQDIQKLLASSPRAPLLYMREFDPQNDQLMPQLIEANTKRHGGLLSFAKSTVSDILGRPIGATLDLMGKPSKWVEIEYGTHFVWNDIGDASLRRAMSKYTYEARFNLKDFNNSWERKARLEAESIQTSGLTGDAASTEFERWAHNEGNPGMSAFITDAVSQMTFDPLWLLPTETLGKGAGTGVQAAARLAGADVEQGNSLSRLFRLGAAGLARSTFGFHTVKEMLNSDELLYQTARVTTPGLRGSLLWLGEKTPARFADSAAKEVRLALSSAMLSSPDLKGIIGADGVIPTWNEMLRTGKVSDRAAAMFGSNVFEANPTLARYQALLTKHNSTSVEGLTEWLTKNEQLATAPPNEVANLVTNFADGQIRELAKTAQAEVFPQWFTKRWLPLVAWQKASMGMFTLSRPGFVTLNMANNLFTYLWTAAGHPFDAVDFARHSFGAEFGGSRELPELMQRHARTLGVDASEIERTLSGNVTRHEIFGSGLRKASLADEKDFDVDKARELAHLAVSKPLKDLTDFRFRDLVTWPITMASRLDRATRRATLYHSINEQLNLAMTINRQIGGVIPELKQALTDAGLPADVAMRWEGYMIDAMRNHVLDGGSLRDGDALRAAWVKSAHSLIAHEPSAHVSAFDYALRFATEKRGMSEESAVHWMRDLSPVMKQVHADVFSQIGKVPHEQLLAKLDEIGHKYWTIDNVAANATRTPNVMRPANSYTKQVSLTNEGLREDMLDSAKHIDRLMGTALPDWTGNAAARRDILGTADDMIQGRLRRLASMADEGASALAQGISKDPARLKAVDEAWKDYYDFSATSQRKLYDVTMARLAGVDEHQATRIESWFALQVKTEERHQKILQLAREADTPETWERAGVKVRDLYEQTALRRARIFGWTPNETVTNMGHMRGTAPLTRQVEDYLQFIGDNLGTDLAAARASGKDIATANTAHNVLLEKANEFADAGPDVARQIFANARAKTDFTMLDYDNQIGADSFLQMFFPYEFFPTRTAMNWGIRFARNPGAGAALTLAILNPGEYAEHYGMPSRLKYKIPIPIPFLSDWMRNMPFIGDKVSGANFGSLYWIDPMQMMFPLTGFRDQFDDDQKTGVGLGGVANYFDQNTPLSLSPYAKIIGGFTGLLDRDAWTNSLFGGGPFGIPMTAYGAAAGKWLFTGDGSDVPDSEKDSYSRFGHFTKDFLKNIFGMDGNRFDQYRRERALSSLVADGTVTPDEAWEALDTHKGDAWKKAVKAAEGEKFLSDLTGLAGFRVTGSLKGEQIRLGEKALYSKAAAEGNLSEFFKKFPEYEVYKASTKGIQDPKEEQSAVETHLYYRDIEQYVNAPYQKQLDDIEMRIDAIRNKDNITETDEEQIKYYNDNVGAIKKQQDAVRSMVERAYPNRDQTASLFQPPKERALEAVSKRWYALQQGQGDGVPADETYEDFQARREQFLASFPSRDVNQDEQDWQDLFTAYLTTSASFNLSINKAYNDGNFDKGDELQAQRDAALEQIHAQATDRVTRYDVEQYLAQFQRRATPAEVEFNDASSAFDVWMSLVSDTSPLNSHQKAAVSAAFRQYPLLQKHYNASIIDLRNLNANQLYALVRRKEIKAQYANLATDDAKIDYMRSVADEYNAANAVLGLPPVDILDARPEPPHVGFSDPYTAQQGFTGGRDFADFYTGSSTDAQDDQPMALSPEDVGRYVDAAINRGY